MSDYDSLDIAGGDAQCMRDGGSFAASTSQDLSNASFWLPSTDCTYKYNNPAFAVAINITAGTPKRVPKDVTSVILFPATAIAYMRIDKV